jgi:type I restriction-modification system DNA methylase subunit
MNNKFNYDVFYEILSELREEFHKVGRLDDSNSKLDEIVKLIVLGYSEAVKGVKFDLKFVKNFALEKYGDDTQIAQAVRDLFESCIQDDMFKNNDGTNIFGSNPMLNIQPSENLFAQKLINEISKIDFLQLVNLGTYSDFDIFNECFGHFVRENFRNNKEDAQYMTPAEISEPIIEMVFNDIIKDGNFIERLISDESDFIVMDPTCGVGTLLIEAIKYITKIVDETELDEHTKNRIIHKIKSKGVFGQDKVDRMVRLSKINMLLINAEVSNINTGNRYIEWMEKKGYPKFQNTTDYPSVNFQLFPPRSGTDENYARHGNGRSNGFKPIKIYLEGVDGSELIFRADETENGRIEISKF